MKAVVIVYIMSLLFCPSLGQAASLAQKVNKANQWFAQGKYDEAAGIYQNVVSEKKEDPLLNYNFGTVLYKQGDYPQSVEQLSQAVKVADPQVAEHAKYNLGNALYKRGIAKENMVLDEAIADLEKSLSLYQQVKKENPQHADAQYNFDFVSKELQRLKEKKQKQEQEGGEENQDKENKENKDKQEQSKDQQQDQQKQDKQNQQDKQDQNKDQKKSDQSKDQQNKDQDQQNQKDQQDKKSQDKNKDDSQTDGNEPSEEQGDEEGSGRPDTDKGELSKKEAKAILDDYQRNEEPKGMLYFIQKENQEKPVVKDW